MEKIKGVGRTALCSVAWLGLNLMATVVVITILILVVTIGLFGGGAVGYLIANKVLINVAAAIVAEPEATLIQTTAMFAIVGGVTVLMLLSLLVLKTEKAKEWLKNP